MKAIAHRIPLDSRKCTDFRKHFGRPKGITVNVKKRASVFDTLYWMRDKKIPSELGQTKAYAKHLKGKSNGLYELCIRTWNDLFGCTRYKFDDMGQEQVRSPERLVYDQEGDCDCFVSFMSSVLTNLGIPHLLRMTAYKGDWQHIYVIVPKQKGKIIDPKNPSRDVLSREEYIVLDPVIEVFDKEKPYAKKYDALMSRTTLQSLSGLGTMQDAPCGCQQTGELGFLKKVFDKLGGTKVGKAFRSTRDAVKKGAGKVFKTFNRFLNPAAILLRNGILLGMKINMFKIGEKLRWGYLSDEQLKSRSWQQSSIDKIRKAIDKLGKIHEGAGGKKSNLKSAILKGKGNKDNRLPSDLMGLGSFEEIDIYDDPLSMLIAQTPIETLEREVFRETSLNGLGEVATASALAAASSILAAIATIVSSIKPPPEETSESWDTSPQFPQEQMSDPFLNQIINNPEGFDVNRAVQVSENYSQENTQTINRAIEKDKKGDNKTLLIGGAAAAIGLLLYLNRNQKPPAAQVALAGTKPRNPVKKWKKTKSKTKTRPARHQSLKRIVL